YRTVASLHGRDRHEREIPRSTLHHLDVALTAPGGASWHLDMRHELAALENCLAVHPFRREDVELLDGNRAISPGPRDVNRGFECGQGHRRIRWMHDMTGTAAEDRVVLILAFGRRTRVAPTLEARDSRAQIPAAGSLAQVSAD